MLKRVFFCFLTLSNGAAASSGDKQKVELLTQKQREHANSVDELIKLLFREEICLLNSSNDQKKAEFAGMTLVTVTLLAEERRSGYWTKKDQEKVDDLFGGAVHYGDNLYCIRLLLEHGIVPRCDKYKNTVLHVFAKNLRERSSGPESYYKLGFALLGITDREKVPLSLRVYYDEWKEENERIDQQARSIADSYELQE